MYACLQMVVGNILDKDPAYVSWDEIKLFLRSMSNETRLFIVMKVEGR